jgi:hypothetical protein
MLLSLGAINKHTNEYVYPKIANKKDEYICPDCNKDLILCQGEVRVHHFRHKVDAANPCHHYSNPTESQIHKDGKILLKTLLEKKIPISFIRNCISCKKNEEYEIHEITESSDIQLEYRFDYNGPKIADVAYIDEGDICCIFEICNTHKTSSENRPEPWFEIDAKTLIQIANDMNTLQIPCIRCEKCDICIESNLKVDNIEKYVRIKLGQKIFPKLPIHCSVSTTGDCDCEDCKYCLWYDTSEERSHLRINYDALNYYDPHHEYEKNKHIMELFSDDFYNNNVVIQSYKGGLIAYIISNENYIKYNTLYWECYYDKMTLPYEEKIDFGGVGTVDVIVELIEICKRVNSIKQPKIKEIKYQIEKCKKSFVKVDMDSMYEDNKSQKNQLEGLETELYFIENSIKYLACGPNIYKITSLTNYIEETIRVTSKGKAFVNGRWIHITFQDIIKWYFNDENNAIDNDTKEIKRMNDGSTLEYTLTAKNKTERRCMLSKYLQTHNVGQLSQIDKIHFVRLYDKFYIGNEENPKFNINLIEKVTIENADYGSKCFNIFIDNNKYSISINKII